MNIWGKKILNFLTIVVNGKPTTITPETPEKLEEITEVLRKASKGDEEAIAELKTHISKTEEERLPEITGLKTIVDKIEKSENKLIEGKIALKENQLISELENNPLFDIVKEGDDIKYFLKGFKAELPMVFVQKLAEMISKKEDIKDLVQFWQLNLLNDNADARRGLYKYLTKQKLMIFGGYFITFRRVWEVKSKSVVKSTSVISEDTSGIIQGFLDKVKRWKRGRRNFEVYQNKKTKELILTDIKKHEANTNDHDLSFLGTLHDVAENMKNVNETASQATELKEANPVKTYTDDRTKTMVIRINEPVRQDRSKCDPNPNVDCSYGLHVGTPAYVGKGGLGDTIVACLVNPMHVISVPYSDAHKMRVCEYFPFKVITREEMDNFDPSTVSEYVKNYKKIEAEELKKALDVIDNLKPSEKKEFKVEKTVTSQEDIDKLIEELNKHKKDLKDAKASVSSMLNDDVSKALDVEEIRAIIKARLSA
jgi:hypothetical protein